MAVYATGQDLIDCFDVDMVGDLAQDSREEQDVSSVPGLPIVGKFLEQASGALEVALIAGGRYRPEQLVALTGVNQAFLKRVVCTIAMSMLFKRRPSQQYLEIAKQFFEESEGYLRALQTGKNLFNIEENKAASTIELQSVSSVEIDNLNLLPSRMSNYFPSSNTRLPRRR